jgi:hypothetical protein
MYSLIPQTDLLTWEEGRSKCLHILPSDIQEKLNRRKSLSENDMARQRAQEELAEDIKKTASRRARRFSGFHELHDMLTMHDLVEFSYGCQDDGRKRAGRHASSCQFSKRRAVNTTAVSASVHKDEMEEESEEDGKHRAIATTQESDRPLSILEKHMSFAVDIDKVNKQNWKDYQVIENEVERLHNNFQEIAAFIRTRTAASGCDTRSEAQRGVAGLMKMIDPPSENAGDVEYFRQFAQYILDLDAQNREYAAVRGKAKSELAKLEGKHSGIVASLDAVAKQISE